VIAGLRGTATVILVAHDAATRKLADRVVKLDGGTPAEQVSPANPESGAAASGRAVQRDAHLGRGPGEHLEPPTTVSTLKALARILAPVRYKFAGAVLIAALAALFAVAL